VVLGLIRHRETARVLLQADSGRFLLMFSLWSPESALEPRWVSPGGGLEGSEPLNVAASRELLEETGLLIKPELLGAKIASVEFTQAWPSGDHETGIAHFFKFRISEEFDVDRSMWTPEEHRDILDVRWWNPSDLKESGERVGPPGLIDLLVELG
jgi:8-oxo-dGTP pyrophosphatase MutT (NUDIX family)